MSSILRALKKLESEIPPQDKFQSWSGKIDTKRAIYERVRRSWRFRKVFSIFFTVAIIAVAVWFILSKKPYLVDRSVTDVASLNPDKKDVSMAPLPVRKKVRRIPAPGEDTETVQREPPVGVSGSELTRGGAVMQAISPMSDADEYGKPLEENQRSVTTGGSAPTKEMGKPRLKLQAIVWSSDPKERIAVINGAVLREGDSIEEFSVARIDADVVVVREGAAEWKLLFDLK